MRARPLAALALTGTVVAAPALAAAAPAGHDRHGHHHDWVGAGAHRGPLTFAVIGDTPYGADKIARFPKDIDRLNADKDLQALVHLGDIKSGSTPCTNEYNAWVKGQFDRLTMPLVYTPGDNEWTDCHRANNGGYNPLERLAAIRNTFFANPGHTMGVPLKVTSQLNKDVPENISTVQAGVYFATLHVVGSNDGLAPWTGASAPNTAQVADEKVRMNAAVEQVRTAFREARRHNLRAVVLMQQADMFDGSYDGWRLADNSAFLPLVKVLAEESNRFKGATYLFVGDSHAFTDDRPLAKGSVWLQRYGLKTAAPALHRITVNGSAAADEYLKVTVRPARPGAQDVLTYQHVSLVG